MHENYSFDDVLLVPQYSNIKSRSEISIATDLGCGVKLDIPIISSPMDTVTGIRMASAMHQSGAMGVMHRYNSPEEQANMIFRSFAQVGNVGAAVGVGSDMMERASGCITSGAKLICIDVAHGHHILVKNAILNLKDKYGDKVHIMAGNVATAEGFEALQEWGADSIRVGIGGGSICSTRIETGHGMPTLSSVMACSKVKGRARLIADGGIKNAGDIAKAIAAGADAVMLGSMLAGTDQTPGDFTFVLGKKVKKYRGMASKEAQIDWRGHFSSSEGVSRMIPYKGCVKSIISGLERSIRSAFSYTGARNICEFQEKAKFIRQSSSSQVESSTHVDLIT